QLSNAVLGDGCESEDRVKCAVSEPGDFEHPFSILQGGRKLQMPGLLRAFDDTWINLLNLVRAFAIIRFDTCKHLDVFEPHSLKRVGVQVQEFQNGRRDLGSVHWRTHYARI